MLPDSARVSKRSRLLNKLVISIATAIVLAFLLIVVFQPIPVLRWLARRSPGVLYFVNTQEKVVALTIDDVPHPQVTPEILDSLKENGARATFFVIGQYARENEEILARARREGHELGNHLMRDFPAVRLSPEQLSQELAEVDAMIRPTGSTKWFRPGSGWYSRRMIEQAEGRGYRCALGSVYPFDNALRNESAIARYVSSQVFPGAIIILHDGKPERTRTAAVLRRVLPELKAKGYRVVTLSELAAAGEK